MKKLFLMTCLLFFLVVPSLGLAADNVKKGGGFTGLSAAKTTVAEVEKMADDAWVTLEGKIEKQLGHEKYQFNDGTGTIVLDIDDKRWQGLTVGPEDTVIITGEIDKDFRGREIEVKVITKK